MSDHNFNRVAPTILRVQGPAGPSRKVRAEARQTQWLRALFAYAELHGNPSLDVRPELEPRRTVPAVRWRCHRDLLQAHAALVAALPRATLRTFRGSVTELVRVGASYEQVETELGEFQALDAGHILSNCPFLRHTGLGSTYWSGGETRSLEEPPPLGIRVSLGTCRAIAPRPLAASPPVCVSVAAHAPWNLLESDCPRVAATDLSFATNVQTLEARDDDRDFSARHVELVEHLPLVDGQAAWAVAIRIEETVRSSAQALEALDAALALVRALAVSSETRVPGWQRGEGRARVMAVADVVRDAAIAVLSAFECLQRCFFHERVPPNQDRYLFDSKHFCAESADAINRTLGISGLRYSVSLAVSLDEDLDPFEPTNEEGLRSSTVRLRTGRRPGLARKRSV